MALFQIHAYSPFMVVSPSNLYEVETTALSNAMNHDLMISLLKHVARRPPSLLLMFIRNIAVSLVVNVSCNKSTIVHAPCGNYGNANAEASHERLPHLVISYSWRRP
jgi:hypothetical protein